MIINTNRQFNDENVDIWDSIIFSPFCEKILMICLVNCNLQFINFNHSSGKMQYLYIEFDDENCFSFLAVH